MLESPDLPNERIAQTLAQEYGLQNTTVEFLPLGADLNTAVYRIASANSTYFLKLRSGDFNPASVTLPKFLHDQGISKIIPPIPTKTGHLWSTLDTYKTILYPFVAGKNGYEQPLTAKQWREFGATLKQIHTTQLPRSITRHIKADAYSLHWCKIVQNCLTLIDHPFVDPVATAAAIWLRTKTAAIAHLVAQTEKLARHMAQNQHDGQIVCHADLHAGNLLLCEDDTLYIVDWDTLVIAPKERDLMYIGGGLLASGRTPQEEEALFFKGYNGFKNYGDTKIDPTAIAYYRCARIVEDIAIYCDQLLRSDKGGSDREVALSALQSNFEPNGTIDRAYAAMFK